MSLIIFDTQFNINLYFIISKYKNHDNLAVLKLNPLGKYKHSTQA